MDSENLRSELARLKALCGAPKNEAEQNQYNALVSELERKFLRLKQDEWKRTVDYVAEHRKAKGHPMLSDFIGAVAALRHIGRIAPPPACEGCSGTGFVMRRYMRTETKEIVNGAVPCPGCRGMDYDTWQLKDGLSPLEDYGTDSALITQAKSLSPGAARAAFEMIEKYKFLASVPAQLIETLLERAQGANSVQAP